MAIPRFACSLTVATPAIIGVAGTAITSSPSPITIPAGTYWADPLYGTALVSVSSPCPLGRICYLISTVGTSTSKNYTGSGVHRTAYFDPAATTLQFQPQHASANAAGRALLRRLGIGPVTNYPLTAAATVTGGPILGVWYPTRGESGDTDEQREAFATTSRTFGGSAYASSFGAPLQRREVTFSGLTGPHTKSRTGQSATLATPVAAFESLLWEPLVSGEFVRYYSDASALATTYLTAACTATATGLTVASTTGVVDDGQLWVDGEMMTVTSVNSGTGLTVDRFNPVAHGIYAPVSTSFVATYALDNDGGNANCQGFTAQRRAYNQDRFDVVIPLVRAQST